MTYASWTPDSLYRPILVCGIFQAVKGFSVEEIASNMYSFDPDIAQSILTRSTLNKYLINIHMICKIRKKMRGK